MRPVTLQDYKRRLLRVLVHIQQHLDEPLPLEELAALACFSPCHFHRLFTGMVGESVKEHVRRLRLERAASRLKLSSLAVTRIGLDAGYESLEGFSRAFRALFGVSPSQFRSQARRQRLPASASGLHFTDGAAIRQFKSLKPGDKNMKVRIEHLQPLRVAFMRHVGPYGEVGATWDKLLPFLGKEGFLGGDVLLLGVCHDDPEVTPPAKIRYDACVSVDAGFVPTGDIGSQVIAGGDYAVTTHFGPYQELAKPMSDCSGNGCPGVDGNCVPVPASRFT
jgi:AraC family transcriptional regulator